MSKKNAGTRFYEGLLEQARAKSADSPNGLVRVTLVEEGVAMIAAEDSIPKPEFDKLCAKVKDERGNAVMVALDDIQFFTQADWTKLRDAGVAGVLLIPDKEVADA